MPKSLARIVALLLVPCLLADPGTASVAAAPYVASRITLQHFDLFGAQALTQTPVGAQRYSMKLRIGGLQMVGVAVIALIGSTAQGQTSIPVFSAGSPIEQQSQSSSDSDRQ